MSRGVRRALVLMVVVGALPVFAQAPAPAEAVQHAREAFQAGQALYKDGRFREAAAKFEQANALSPRAGNWFNVARCYEQVGEVAKALAAYRSYLREAPAAAEKPEVDAAIGRLQALLKSSGVQQVLVRTEPGEARATVSVDGRAVGPSPVTVELNKGQHTFTAEAAGFASVERRLEVSLDAATDVTLTLTPADAPLQPSFTPLAMQASAPPPLPPLVVAARKPYVFAWAGLVSTVVVVGVGALLHGLAGGVQDSMRNPPSGMPRTYDQNQELYSQGTTLQVGAFIGYGTGGALALSTALLFAFEGTSP
jgi:tetratricopeptide (TPR) repeat protein